ncbi:uncharacterized protein CLUP02_14269 [Colletotrichum lupini]|uniref:Uncharacterized protein n=1 Tax=Colletotrichum lupini TaxID=145971 RepID=A0A9Q8T3W2_9PEZI|nr:uncharacterized protein CLUP02_14269 [Colletotrichum lupini]UQC88744.1 hypothetical protein CLUP02_14269 [Colletotrichum lupini]
MSRIQGCDVAGLCPVGESRDMASGHTRAAGMAAGNGDDLVWNLPRKQHLHRQTANGMATDQAFGGGSELSPYSRTDIESQT